MAQDESWGTGQGACCTVAVGASEKYDSGKMFNIIKIETIE